MDHGHEARPVGHEAVDVGTPPVDLDDQSDCHGERAYDAGPNAECSDRDLRVILRYVRRLLRFPNPVNEIAARTVAAGVLLQALAFVVTGWRWLTVPLAFGFVARVASGPTFSPLGRLATQVIVPRLGVEARPVPGPPKRFAQGIGAVLATAGLVAAFAGVGWVARLCVGAIVVAASLESGFGICLGCIIFRWLMRAHLIPETVCEACADVRGRLASSTGRA